MRSKFFNLFNLLFFACFPVAGIILACLRGPLDLTGDITLLVLYGVLGLTGEYWRRQARLARDTSRLMAEQLDRLQPGEGWKAYL